MKKDLLSIAIPCFNESGNLKRLIEEITSLCVWEKYQLEIILVDDGSRDNTWDIICELRKSLNFIKGIKLVRNFGKEISLLCGVKNVSKESKAVITLDSDLQHPPSFIPRMIEEWEMGESYIIEAVKKCRGTESAIYKVITKHFYSIMKIFSSFDLENSSDFKILDKKVVQVLKRIEERNYFFRGILAWTGFPVKKLQFSVEDRYQGNPSMTLYKKILFSFDSMTSVSGKPLGIVFVLSFMFFLLSIILGAQSIYLKLNGQSPDGYTTIVILILITGSFLFFSLGIIGKYLSNIYSESKMRPLYIVEIEI